MESLSYFRNKVNKYEIAYRWNNYITTDWIIEAGYSDRNKRDSELRRLKIKYKDSPREYIKVNNTNQ